MVTNLFNEDKLAIASLLRNYDWLIHDDYGSMTFDQIPISSASIKQILNYKSIVGIFEMRQSQNKTLKFNNA